MTTTIQNINNNINNNMMVAKRPKSISKRRRRRSAAAFISGALLVLVVSVSAVSAQDEEESTESFSSAVAAGLATGQILPSDSFGPGFLADGIDTSGDGVETIEENGMAIALVAGNLVFEGEGEATLETEATESGDGSASGFSDVSAFAGGAGGGGEASSNNYIAAGAEEAATTALTQPLP